MKKYVLLAITLILIIASLFLTVTSPATFVVAGSGSKTPSKIKDLDGVYSVWNFISERSEDFELFNTEHSGTHPYEIPDDDDIKIKNFRSVTYTEYSEGSYKQPLYMPEPNKDQNPDNKDQNPDNKDQTQMPSLEIKEVGDVTVQYDINSTVYITKTRMYIDCSGYAVTYYTGNGESENDEKYAKQINQMLEFDMEIYIEKKFSMVRIQRYSETKNDQKTLLNTEYLGKWVELSVEDTLTLVENIGVFKTSAQPKIAEWILLNESDNKECKFNKNSGSYTMNIKIDKANISTAINLSDRENPYIEYKYDMENSEKTTYINLSNIITFKDVDNTGIGADKNSDSIISDCETDDLFDVILYKNNDNSTEDNDKSDTTETSDDDKKERS